MRKLCLGLSFVAMAILVACGDSSSKANSPEVLSVDTYDDLPNCTENREGMEATTEDGEAYTCVDGEWTEASEPVSTYETFDDLPNCTAKREDETAYVKEDKATYVCTDGEWGTDLPGGSSSSSSKSGGKNDDDEEGGDEYDGKTVEGSCYPDRAVVLKNDTVTWHFERAVLDTSAKAADIVAYYTLVKGTDCVWTLAGATEDSIVVKCSKSSVTAVYAHEGSYGASIGAGENTITCSGIRVVNEYPSSSSEEPESSNEGESSSSAEPESSSVEESSSSAEPESSSVEESSSSSEPESSSVEESSSSAEPVSSSVEESSSSAEPESSSEEESSSSVSPASSDASIYNATANTLTDLRDGQVYRTTTIVINDTGRGISYSEVWMAENLNFVTENSWCCGGSGTTEGNCSVYGRLYTWAMAMAKAEDSCGYGYVCDLGTGDIRGVCPKGWHVPSREEWETLIVAVDGSIVEYDSDNMAGHKLKSSSGWNGSGNGTDNYGFSALPVGFRHSTGDYYNEGYDANFWSSTEYSGGHAYYMDLYYYYGGASLDYGSNKNYGFSVRCLKD